MSSVTDSTEKSCRKSLYVHIPFCVSKCFYCDFFSCKSQSVPDSYIQAVLNECRYMVNLYGITGWSTVYIGGGTPSLMTPLQMETLLKGLYSSVPEGFTGEVTMEMNPESVSEEKISTFGNLGGNRISMGVQSLTESALLAVGRHCSAKTALKGVETVSSLWDGRLNLDAIAGLPLQSDSEFMDSLEKILSFNPDHISLYSLMVEEETPLYKKIQQGLPYNEDDADNQWLMGRDFLQKRGFRQYEVSNFAKEGKESRHNMAYWKQEDYIGIGSGATGSIYWQQTGFRWNNNRNTDAYISFWNQNPQKTTEIPREEEVLDVQTMEFECLMMGLRTIFGVNDALYRERYASVSPWFGDLEKRLSVCGSEVKKTQRKDGSSDYALEPQGLLFLNSLLSKLI